MNKIHPYCVNERNDKIVFTNIFDGKLESHTIVMIFCLIL